ncbi:MAG: c-type cytochrome [Mariprofundus sp.]|nr:c-type cytochrome [Mariprofundus sp.]
MKKSVFWAVVACLSLMACDNKNASQTTAVTAAKAPVAATVVPAADKPINDITVTDTVAVTKHPRSTVGSDMQQSVKQSVKENQATIAALNTSVKEADVVLDTPHLKTIAAPITRTSPAKRATKQLAVVGDAVKGKKLAKKCMSCHSFSDKKKMGPGLKNIVGRKAGSVAGIRYGAALKAAHWSWNEQNLALWLCDAKQAIKSFSGDAKARTRMPNQRICAVSDQQNIIAFLRTL